VSGNSTGSSGGGIALASTTTIADSTISGNRAAVDGGGMQSLGGQTVDIENTTITANLADWDDNGTGDGGGFARGAGNVFVANTILARNVDAGGEAPDCTGTLGTLGHNLIGANDSCVASAGTGDQLGTVAAPIDPRLAPLADNGGSTDTHALLPGSPAVHAGSPLQPGSGGSACAALDQRGVPRSACDIGGYQLVRCFGRPVTVVGTPVGDVLRGTGADEAFLAMGGNDLIQAGGGVDRVCAGPGADRVFGEGGDDLLAAGPGPDSLDGGSGTDLCQGGPGPDTAVRCEHTRGV
jgi:Ca2+-binding RTX toxin-like protein